MRSTQTSLPTNHSTATSLPPIGNRFLYMETSGNIYGSNIFCAVEKTDVIKYTNMTIYYNRFSILTNYSLKPMGRFRIQLLLKDNTWSTMFIRPKKDQYTNSSTQGTLLSLNFTVEKFGIKLSYTQIDIPHANMCFSNLSITHSIY